jgi:glycosyltransferase involved in cell wall biosynthesis
MNHMRIVLVGKYPIDPNNVRGGPQAVFTYLLQGLERHPDLELHVITARKSITSPYIVQRNGVEFHYLPYPDRTTLLAVPTLQRSIRRVLSQIQPDLVHGQSNNVLGCIALSAGYPTVLTAHSVHGSEIEFSSKWINRLNLRVLHALMRNYFTSHARHVVSISPYIRRHYEPQMEATFHEIDNPVADEFFELDPSYEIPNRILFVGYLNQRKRPDLALNAFHLARKQVPQLNMHFAGAAIHARLAHELHDFVAEHRLGECVQFLGHLSETEVLEAYQQMSILLLTSELETSPMVVEQAMAAGKAVVATAVGGVPFLVDHGRTGFLVEPNEPAQLAQALVTLAQDPELRRRMGQAARQEALDRFKANVVADSTYAMYQEILG